MKFRIMAVILTTTPQFVQDATLLANDALSWIIAISSVVAAALGAFFLVKWYSADENEKAPAMKKVKQVVLGAVGVLIFEAILKLVLSYFTH